MPYKLYKDSDSKKWCVKNSETGESKGCSDTRKMATAHLRAMYAAEGGAKMGKKDLDELVEKAVNEFVSENPTEADEFKAILAKGYVPYGITSFDELDKYRGARDFAHKTYSLTDDFNELIWGIMNNTDIEDKATAVKSLSDEYATRIKALEDDYDKDPNKKEDEYEKESLGFLDNVKATISNTIKSIFKIDPDEPKAADDDLSLFKDAEGRYHFLVTYSNNFRDDDNPREIISAKSHRRFVDMVDKGQAPLPELWVWHRPEWKIGQATWVAYDDAGFSVAAGDIDKGCEEFADYLSQFKGIRLSHGMPLKSIRRDPENQTIILEHTTKEITLLPGFAAANPHTFPGFVSLRDADLRTMEDDMSIPKSKVDALKAAWGEKVTPFLEDLQKRNAELAVAAAKEGRDNKEKDEPVTPPVDGQVTAPPEPVATVPVEPPVEPVKTEGDNLAPEFATIKDISEAFATTVQPFIDALKTLDEKVDSLTKELDGIKTDRSTRIKEVVASTPAASVAAMIAQHLVASGSKDTEIGKGDKLAKSKPAETQPGVYAPTGIQFIDEMLAAKPNPQ